MAEGEQSFFASFCSQKEAFPPTLILAGGQGRRLGGVDKALLPFAGGSLLSHLLARLPSPGPVAISANGDPARFAGFGLPVLADGEFGGKGPLAGIAAGLAWAEGIGAASLLTVPVDTPFIPLDLAVQLGVAPAVAVWRGRQHHLVASWCVSFAKQLREILTEPGAYRVVDALALAQARQVAFVAAEDPFLNINTAADLEAAVARLAGAP